MRTKLAKAWNNNLFRPCAIIKIYKINVRLKSGCLGLAQIKLHRDSILALRSLSTRS